MDDKKFFESEAYGVFELVGAEVQAEEILTAGNSFFDKNYFGTRILILAPHPDDEINVAGNMILNLSAAKAEIFVVYSTNGDFDISADIRAQEAVNSLKILGVPAEKIIFLGYGDTFNGKGNPHIFSAENPTSSPAGHKKTYAPKNFVDYSKKIFGQHSFYTRKNFKRDLKSLILELRANIIFCVDFDSHADHRTLSVLFEEVLGEILSENSNYRPEIYKKFAYSTAFTAAPDFYAINLRATPKPKIGETDTYDFDFIDRANYVWENRIRFPVADSCRQTILKDNLLAEAIFAHKSQKNEWNALRILNSDEIFFERRTDSQTFSAKVTATSGNPQKVCDFKIIDTKNVDICPPQIENNLWRPAIDDFQKKIFFEWNEPIQVQKIVIYGNPLDENSEKIFLKLVFDKPTVDFKDFKTFNVEIPARGCPFILDTEKFYVKRAEITALNPKNDFGIAEIEFFANVEPIKKISPFIKITSKDNFIYRYAIPYEIDKISLGIYRFHVENPIKITATAHDEAILSEILTDGELILNFGNEKEVVVTAEVLGDLSIYDRVIIRRIGDFAQIQLKIWQWLDKLRIHKIRKMDR